MSMMINSVPAQGVGYGSAAGASTHPAHAAPAHAELANDFAAYAAPRVRRDTAATAGGQNTIPVARAQAIQPGISPETLRLQLNVGLLNLAKAHIKEVANRLEDYPRLGLKPGQNHRTLEGVLDFVVAETKRSGLYDRLQRAAIQRLKDSGSYESLISQVLEKEAAKGRPRDRAWAENWIEDQFDYDRVGQNYVADAPYFEPADSYGQEVTSFLGANRGNAMFYGDPTVPRVQGSFAITFSEIDGIPMYRVRNLDKGREESAPKLYDANGTVIKGNGLYAEMFGVPAPNDQFVISGPFAANQDKPKMVVHYYDAAYTDMKPVLKKNVFNSLFNPVFNGNVIRQQPADIINRAI
jgi:hypothetical protein